MDDFVDYDVNIIDLIGPQATPCMGGGGSYVCGTFWSTYITLVQVVLTWPIFIILVKKCQGLFTEWDWWEEEEDEGLGFGRDECFAGVGV